MQNRWIDEVVELHRFFEGWLSGTLDNTQETFRRFEQALAEGFVMVEPNGILLRRETLLTNFRNAHGAVPKPFTIEVRNPEVKELNGSLALVTYEEWQLGREQTARVSSALLHRTQGALEWLHVHETWVGTDSA